MLIPDQEILIKRQKEVKALRCRCSFNYFYGVKPHFRRYSVFCQNKKFYVSISFAYRKADEVLCVVCRFLVQATAGR
jgi:hypothetical protein